MEMIGLIAVLNLAGILLMYCLRTSALADVGNNPGEVEGITSGIGGNIVLSEKYCVGHLQGWLV